MPLWLQAMRLPAGTWEIRVDPHSIPEGPQRYSLVSSERLLGAVDVMLVLDRSGSMNSTASAGMPDTKIETLRDAITEFLDVMLVDQGYQLGLVQFNQNVVPFRRRFRGRARSHTRCEPFT